jgi:hypothetical protein
MEANATRDSLLAWPSDTTGLRSRMFLLRDDTVLIDTLRYLPSERMPYDVVLTLEERPIDQGTEHLIRASRPVARIDQQRIRSLPVSEAGVPALVKDPSDARVLRVDGPSNQDVADRIELLPGAVTDIYGGGHDSLRFDLAAPSEKVTGTLRVKFDRASSGPALLQLLTAQGNVMRATAVTGTTGEVRWSLLHPGSYALKWIEDENANQRWDTGSLAEDRLPERVYHRSGPISIRSSWDVEVEWAPIGP